VLADSSDLASHDARIPVALTIAGSDSGAAGRDTGRPQELSRVRRLWHHGDHGGDGAEHARRHGVHPIPVDTVREQIRAVAEDLRPAACKSGMLATAELVRAVAASIREHALAHYVLDPVMVASSGDRLLDQDAERTVAEELVPLAALVTPNLDEAAILVGFAVEELEGMRRAAAALVEMGAGAALLKGGHLRASELVDVLFDGREWHEWRRPKLDTRSTHGTGLHPLRRGGRGARAWAAPHPRRRRRAGLREPRHARRARPGRRARPLNHMVGARASTP
jgi:hydroxymethylpyrimidine/phosphomethylpyrimidine kinase